MFIEWGGGYCLYYLGEVQVFIEWGVIVYIIFGRGQVFIEWGGGYCLYYLGEGAGVY